MLAATAVILAGGKSSRMGFDKQCIKINEKPLIEQQIHILRSIFKEIIVVTHKPQLYKNLDCILTADQLVDFGPMSGIHAGLKASQSEFSYVLACDMPNINQEYILHMLRIIGEDHTRQQAVVTRFGSWLEPFNAFYAKSLIPVIEQAYEDKDKKIGNMLARAKSYYIEEVDARSYSPDWTMFANINTREDLIKLK